MTAGSSILCISEEQRSMKSVYSNDAANQIQISYFYQMGASKNGMGNNQERGRERDEQIKRVGGRAKVRIRNGMSGKSDRG